MASPWKLLARLVSPRRQQRQEHGSTDDVKPDMLAIANPTETAGDIGLNTAAPPVDEKPVADEQSEAVSADPDHSDETASSIHGTADSEDARRAEAADPALSDEPGTVAREAPKPSQTGEGVTRKRRKLTKSGEPVEAVLPPSTAAPSDSDDTISLDEEIKLLRNQLARKLQLQNAQLKRMLERFER
ncbi:MULTISPECIES: hypothetical protein [Rhizobium/Agrobacterium group]|uniref:hypothetical protein n=1 Tax=Rhizobium/Agrobacterium group TaxID=227290 RepID=UPI001ADA65B7|nr:MULTISPECIES: hypothetical protein [Rhizobium/Agrobacterium group]MBO9111928.1 hypothetical protein [Agrobacterium sp. S2/73]QXZ76291.1 hypothetical protein J5276_25350 [Agrobacterium sp. S7/73]QYA17163.1 hypothetical protein J5284_31365 [Rhizobium sp. AB2/73]UEQ85264.1 hypothetical protein I8E17_32690 [Rhizobium sp. AB2/73]